MSRVVEVHSLHADQETFLDQPSFKIGIYPFTQP